MMFHDRDRTAKNWKYTDQYLLDGTRPDIGTESRELADDRETLDAIRDVLRGPANEPLPSIDAAWTAMRTRAMTGVAPRSPFRLSPGSRQSPGRTLAIAVGSLACFGMIVLGILVRPLPWQSGLRPTQGAQQIVTAPGQLANFQLPDGSTVVLGYSSALQIPADFGHTERTVTLVGEAYFTVSANPTRPFIVRSGSTATVRVLGTRFGVRVLNDEASVAVRDGRVLVQAETPRHGSHKAISLIASRGDVVQVRRDGRVSLDTARQTETELSWLDGRLIFDETSLAEALPMLERRYGLRLSADPALRPRRFTASFSTNDPATVLDAIAAILDTRYQRDGQRVHIGSTDIHLEEH